MVVGAGKLRSFPLFFMLNWYVMCGPLLFGKCLIKSA